MQVSMDLMYVNLWKTLVADFQAHLGEDFAEDMKPLISSIKDFRMAKFPSYNLSPYYYFKARYQMENLFKRVCFTDDAYTEEERRENCFSSFKETQARLPCKRPISERVHRVLSKARSHARRILGNYDPIEHASLCRFGKRATVGNSLRKSYLHEKLSSPISGSRDHIKWFENHLTNDLLLREAIRECSKSEPTFSECDALVLTGVPKSWKTFRCIMPNTTIGSFYSSGLGLMFRRRLRGEGLNINYLQDKHKALARKFSVSRSHVTADLSAASDSITSWLLNSILPREWYNAVKLGRISYARIGSEKYFLSSFMTMGIGFTFELETLVFYCLLKAIKDLVASSGIISVYGDDLIYPTSMHSYVSRIFSDVGFILNQDKTFVFQSFRESCGGDYYCGFDVRPFQPEAVCRELSVSSYVVLLYKTINGLLRRWSREEIPLSIGFLEGEILRYVGFIHQVPPFMADGSGVKTPYVLKDFPYKAVTFKGPQLTFEFLAPIRKHRFVTHQCIYYWDTLRSSYLSDEFPPCSFEVDEVPNSIVWLPTPKRYRILNYRSTLTGKRIKQLSPFVARKGVTLVTSTQSAIPRWLWT